jgi:hypothetical protein
VRLVVARWLLLQGDENKKVFESLTVLQKLC